MARQRRGFDFSLLLLFHELNRHGGLGPVTLGMFALMTVIHYNFFGLYIPDTHEVCVGYPQVVDHGEWMRVLLAGFWHVDDMHLYYNMGSWLWKGRKLEPVLGSQRLFAIVVLFAILGSVLLVGLTPVLASFGLQDMYSCAAGFSGVLFGLKVIVTSISPGGSINVLGLFSVPNKYCFWVELLLIQLMTPHVSFLGHLSGILCGLIYVYGFFDPILNLVLGANVGNRSRGHRGGGGDDDDDDPQHQHQHQNQGPRYDYTSRPVGMTAAEAEDEELQEAIRRSMQDYGGPDHGPMDNQGNHHIREQMRIAAEQRANRHQRRK